MQNRSEFLRGAMHLAGAGLIVKVIGACFKIPLGAVLGPEGTALFSVAYNLYAFLFVLATAGVPVAVSKLVAESAANGNEGEAAHTANTARALFGSVGLVFSLLLFFGAGLFANTLGAPTAKLAIRAISPAVFFVSLLSVERGYFQGYGNMLPTAKSEIIEALGKLVLGLSLAWWLKQNGNPLAKQAAGAIGGVSIGCALACVYFKVTHHRVSFPIAAQTDSPLSTSACAKRLLLQMLPVTLAASVIGLVGVIDSAVIMKTLQSVGVSESRAMWMFGTYNYAANLFNLPNALVTALAVSLIPAVAQNAVKGERENLRETVGQALEVGLLVALTGAAGLGMLANPILTLLYGSGVEESAINLAARILVILCMGIPPLALVTVTNAVHQASGKSFLPACAMLVGAAVKLVLNCILLRNPRLHILGAAFSTVFCYTVIGCINWCCLKNKPPLFRLCGKPLAVAVFTGIFARLTFLWLKCLLTVKAAVMLGILAGGVVFFTLVALVKISILPKNMSKNRKS